MEVWKQTLPPVNAGGRMVGYLWDLVAWNGEQITQDFEHDSARLGVGAPSREVAVVGPSERLLIDPTARIEPMVVIDTTGGPVVIDREAVVTAFTRIEGPCYIGPQTQVFGAKIRAGTTLGPQCRVGGEVECSIVHGHANKYHDGFLGHSYVGEWVNLGAGTINSDLRNDYGRVSRGRPAGSSSRQTKVAASWAITPRPAWAPSSTPAPPPASSPTFCPPAATSPSAFPPSRAGGTASCATTSTSPASWRRRPR